MHERKFRIVSKDQYKAIMMKKFKMENSFVIFP